METAALVSGWERGAIQTDERLTEIAFGPWRGASRGLARPLPLSFCGPATTARRRGAKACKAWMARTGAFAAEMLARHAGQRCWRPATALALHALLTCALRRPMSEFWAVNLDNCCVAVLEGSGGPFHLKRGARQGGRRVCGKVFEMSGAKFFKL